MNREAVGGSDAIPKREAASVDNRLLNLLSDKKLGEWSALPESSESFEDTSYQVKGFKTSLTLGESVYEVRLEERVGEVPEEFKDSPIRIRVGKVVEGEMVFIGYNFQSQTVEHQLAQDLYFNLEDDFLEVRSRRVLEAQDRIKAEFESAVLDLQK